MLSSNIETGKASKKDQAQDNLPDDLSYVLGSKIVRYCDLSTPQTEILQDSCRGLKRKGPMS